MPDFALPPEPSRMVYNLADGWHANHRLLKVRLLRDAIREAHGELPRAALILKLREVEVVGLLNLYQQLIRLHRLGKVLGSSELHSLYGGFNAAIGRKDQHFRIGLG